MKTSSIVIAAALLCGPAFAQDSWTGPDKQKHFAFSFGFGFVARGVFPELTAPQAIAVGMIPGIVKELADSGNGGKFSGKDLAWDLAGAAAGVYIGGLVIGPRSIRYSMAF